MNVFSAHSWFRNKYRNLLSFHWFSLIFIHMEESFSMDRIFTYETYQLLLSWLFPFSIRIVLKLVNLSPITVSHQSQQRVMFWGHMSCNRNWNPVLVSPIYQFAKSIVQICTAFFYCWEFNKNVITPCTWCR